MSLRGAGAIVVGFALVTVGVAAGAFAAVQLLSLLAMLAGIPAGAALATRGQGPAGRKQSEMP